MDYIKLAETSDSDAILAVYSPYIEKTAYSFETEPPSKETFRARVKKISSRFPYLVYVRDNEIIGYAYGNEFRERKAYRFMVELTVYIKEDCSGAGIGKLLYERLLIILRKLGYLKVYAGIGLPNENSIKFHKNMGFTETGFYSNSGFKLGEWHSIIYLEKELAMDYYKKIPSEPIGIKDLSKNEINEILRIY